MIVMKKALSRRAMLRAAGVSLALPLLDSMVPALTAQNRTAARPVKRFAAFHLPNGMSIGEGDWWPKIEGTGYEITRALRPLQAFRDQITVLSGLDNRPADPMNEGTGDHTRGPACYLTATRIVKTEGSNFRNGVSMDQVIAQEIGRETQVPSLQIGVDAMGTIGACDPGYACVYKGTLSWKTPTMPLLCEKYPRAIFERLFGDVASSDPRARLAQLKARQSVLDAMLEDVGRFKTTLGPDDRIKVNEYLEAIRDIERRIQTAENQSDRDVPVVDRPEPGVPTTFDEHFHILADLLIVAYQSDLTRVVSFVMAEEQTGRAYPAIGITEPHHNLSHHRLVPETLDKLCKVNVYHTTLFASLLEKMRDIKEGDHSLLDNTALLYGAGISDSDNHLHNNLPILIAGGAGGEHKGGRHIRYPKGTPLANLHLTLINKMGARADSFGDSTGVLAGI